MPDNSRFGYGAEAWDRMVEVGLDFLKEKARLGTTTYTEFCTVVSRRSAYTIEPGDYAVRYLLGDISRQTFKSHQCPITSIVVYLDDNRPGDGFFRLGQELRVLPRGPLSQRRKEQFWLDERRRTSAAFR
ncbi:MAG TPA: hypothetical protein VIX84_15495 [Acidimicrobiales bacterium]